MAEVIDFSRNNYVVGNALTDPNGFGFYGRQDVYNFLREKLSAVHRPAILLHGHRRSGKSSILHQMPRFMPSDWKTVFFDIQGQAYDPLEEVLYGIAYEIDRTVGLGGVEQADVTPDKFRSQFLPRVFDRLDGQKYRLVLLFDEFDILEPTLASELVKFLRELMTAEQEVGYVFVVGRRPEHLPIFREMSTYVYYIGRLSHQETKILICEPAAEHFTYTNEAVERIWALTSGHPLATQLLCFDLWPRGIEQGIVVAEDVDNVITQALRAGDNQLNQIYDGLDDPNHRLFLSALADVAGHDGWVELSTILDHLRRYQVNIGPRLSQVRHDLVTWDIVIVQDDQFRYAVDLVRQWVASNRSLERMRYDAQLVSERAFRFYETAEDLRLGTSEDTSEQRAANLQDAIGDYQRALEINPVLVAARVSLVSALMELGEFETAVKEAERAYETDSGQRDTLREALLRLGQWQEEKGNSTEAMATYNHALDLGEDASARQRLNHLLVKEGEDLLEQGHFTEAIEWFRKAEAKEWIQRATEAWETAWKSIDGRVHNAVQSTEWEKALQILKEYQAQIPTDERATTLQDKVQRQAKAWWHNRGESLLAAGKPAAAIEYFTKAEEPQRVAVARVKAFEAEGKWEEAIEAHQLYTSLVGDSPENNEWRNRLEINLEEKLLAEVRAMESKGDWDAALDIVRRKSAHFLSTDMATLQRRLLVGKARAEAVSKKYDAAFTLLEQAGALNQAQDIVTFGKSKEWEVTMSQRGRLLWAFFVSVFIGVGVWSQITNEVLQFILMAVLGSSFLFLSLCLAIEFVWVNIGLARWEMSNTKPETLPDLFNRKILRHASYASGLALAVVLLVTEWASNSFFGQRQSEWYVFVIAAVVGFLGGLAGGYANARVVAEQNYTLDRMNPIFWFTPVIVATISLYAIPRLLYEWQGNDIVYITAHYITGGLLVIVFALLSVLTMRCTRLSST